MDVLELLEEIDRLDEPYYKGYICKYDVQDIIRNHFPDAKKMVGDWIPVEEGLPEEGQKVLVWYEYFRYGEYNRMFETYGIGWQFDGHWSGDVSGTKARCIAWHPLPEPYRQKEQKSAKNTQQEMEDFWRDK